jgi:NosR/NirI family nitrous oxide reductase transcriptional regulator
VLYAGGLIAVSAVNGNFFCKYLCPLGAALTIGGHFRIFDWLRRRKECGRPCQTCATECPSQAIRPTGEINPNECHYCLDCQMTFWNSHKCPPLVERRKRFERHGQSVKVQLR